MKRRRERLRDLSFIYHHQEDTHTMTVLLVRSFVYEICQDHTIYPYSIRDSEP